MNWEFSIGWFLLGLGIVVVGTLMTVYYQKIADNLASGVSSYDKVKLVGVISILLGLTIMANLHTLLLTALVNIIFKR